MNERERKSKQVLIACAGLGMGNAARVVALVEELSREARAASIELALTVCSWGAGYDFLRKAQRGGDISFHLERLVDYPPGFQPWTYLRAFSTNSFRLARLSRRLRPELILLDSDYHFLAYIFSGARRVFVGQAWDVVRRSRVRGGRWSWRQRTVFFFREYLDAMVQKIFSHRILVPSFSPEAAHAWPTKVTSIPLMVRKEFRGLRENLHQAGAGVGLLLSGSGLHARRLRALAETLQIPVLERTPSSPEELDQFRYLVVQGGLSSISECIARGRYCYVVPMPNHPEQELNALAVEEMGLGRRVSEEEISRLASPPNQACAFLDCEGAKVAAGILLGEINA